MMTEELEDYTICNSTFMHLVNEFRDTVNHLNNKANTVDTQKEIKEALTDKISSLELISGIDQLAKQIYIGMNVPSAYLDLPTYDCAWSKNLNEFTAFINNGGKLISWK